MKSKLVVVDEESEVATMGPKAMMGQRECGCVTNGVTVIPRAGATGASLRPKDHEGARVRIARMERGSESGQ